MRYEEWEQLAIKMIPQQRGRSLQEASVPYDVASEAPTAAGMTSSPDV